MENSEILKRVKLLMEYDTSKTLNENLNEHNPVLSPIVPFPWALDAARDVSNIGKAIINAGTGNESDAILNIRNFLFSNTGLITDVVIKYAGAEFGGFYVMTGIEWLVIINDVYRYKNKIGDQSENFQRILEDILIIGLQLIITGGIWGIKKIRGKSQKELIEMLRNNVSYETWNFQLDQATRKLSKMGRLGQWAIGYLDTMKNIIDSIFKSYVSKVAVAKSITKIPFGMLQGLLMVKFNHLLQMAFFHPEKTPDEYAKEELENGIRRDNPWISSVMAIKYENDGETMTIGGNKYKFSSNTVDDYTLKKVK